ncbi:MAG: hypothetical protein HY077_12295 [Elusimicrobia bacterium]|nr:hypothetical protein [Elusimicrobiota bacterium]
MKKERIRIARSLAALVLGLALPASTHAEGRESPEKQSTKQSEGFHSSLNELLRKFAERREDKEKKAAPDFQDGVCSPGLPRCNEHGHEGGRENKNGKGERGGKGGRGGKGERGGREGGHGHEGGHGREGGHEHEGGGKK